RCCGKEVLPTGPRFSKAFWRNLRQRYGNLDAVWMWRKMKITASDNNIKEVGNVSPFPSDLNEESASAALLANPARDLSWSPTGSDHHVRPGRGERSRTCHLKTFIGCRKRAPGQLDSASSVGEI